MSSQNNPLLDEVTSGAVPQHRLVSYVPILSVLVGIFISLPAFYTGTKVGGTLGLSQGVAAFVIGGIILGAIACLCATVGASTRLSTYKIIEYSFGKQGAILINLIFGFSLFGWFGINSALFGESVLQSLGLLDIHAGSTSLYIIIGGVLMVSTAIFGFKALNKLANMAVPVLCLSLITLVTLSLNHYGFKVEATENGTVSFGQAISIVVGSTVVGAILMPDYCRYARTLNQALIACVITFGLAFPLILSSAAIPALATGESDVIPIITALNVGVMGLVVVIFTAWTTNNANLYSGSLSLAAVFTRLEYWHLVVIAGTIGTLFAVLGIMDRFLPFLLLLGVTMPPVAGVYITYHFCFCDHQYSRDDLGTVQAYSVPALFSWVAASLLGYASANEWVLLSTVPAVDSLLSSALIYGLVKKSALLIRSRAA
jgi:cytosine permease